MPGHPMDMEGRAVLVTGASSGIGRDTAILLAQLNARVVLAARNSERLQQTFSAMPGSGHRIEVVDLSKVDEIPSWIKQVAAECGPLDALVHCAGVHNAHPLRILTAAKWEEVMRLNVTASMMLAKGFRAKGCSAPGASIVLLSSVAGLVGEAGVSAYSASKAALQGLARSLAIELAGQQIRVNCVAPGFVQTEMTEGLRGSLTQEQFSTIEALHPLGLGLPRDVANAIAFLVSPASRWITGSTLVVDGGYTAH